MANLTHPKELFLHELGDILYVEETLADEALPKLIDEVRDEELKAGLTRHLKQTERHVKNVRRAFDLLGETPEAEKCVGFEGIEKEPDKLVEDSSFDLTDIVDAGAAARTEHYEIAAYQGLIAMARSLGEREAARLLETNLKDERETLREVEKIGRRLSRERAKELVAV